MSALNSTCGFSCVHSDRNLYPRLITVDSYNTDRVTELQFDDEFEIDFTSDFNDIKAFQLIACEFPNTQYEVDAHNNTFLLYDAATDANYPITLTPGNYTLSDLATEIQTQLIAAVGALTFTVTLNSSTSKFTIARTGATNFQLLLADGQWGTETSARFLLGFNAVDTTAASSITSTNRVVISDAAHVRVMLRQGVTHSNHQDSDGRFLLGLIKINENVTEAFNFAHKVISEPVSFVGKLNKLRIRFVNRNGAAYRFNGGKFSLTFSVWRND
jgi:hypothetical protein